MYGCDVETQMLPTCKDALHVLVICLDLLDVIARLDIQCGCADTHKPYGYLHAVVHGEHVVHCDVTLAYSATARERPALPCLQASAINSDLSTDPFPHCVDGLVWQHMNNDTFAGEDHNNRELHIRWLCLHICFIFVVFHGADWLCLLSGCFAFHGTDWGLILLMLRTDWEPQPAKL
jgi:hypothetical protein